MLKTKPEDWKSKHSLLQQML